MNLVIDQGNSVTKVALYTGKTLVKAFYQEALTEVFIMEVVREYAPKAGIICSVKGLRVPAYLRAVPSFYKLTHRLPSPLTIGYRTPSTLGMDRFAAAVGAVAAKPGVPLLVIDVGTAITIDYVTDKGYYMGGNISPGIDMRFRALHHFTGRLPLIDKSGSLPDLGYDTETAIRSGVIKGIAYELDAYIDEYKKKQVISVFLTGGSAFYFESKLKNAIFADENLVLNGLNDILNYQQK
jgi:type III pantothenate kinase